MNTSFSKEITFSDGTKELIDFEAQFEKGGIGAWEHFGHKGYDIGPELTNIECISKVSKEQGKYIDDLISNCDLDEDAWNTLEDS